MEINPRVFSLKTGSPKKLSNSMEPVEPPDPTRGQQSERSSQNKHVMIILSTNKLITFPI